MQTKYNYIAHDSAKLDMRYRRCDSITGCAAGADTGGTADGWSEESRNQEGGYDWNESKMKQDTMMYDSVLVHDIDITASDG